MERQSMEEGLKAVYGAVPVDVKHSGPMFGGHTKNRSKSTGWFNENLALGREIVHGNLGRKQNTLHQGRTIINNENDSYRRR